MFGGLASKKGLLAKKGGAADVTPNSLDWTVSGSPTYGGNYTNTLTVIGINSTITLEFSGTVTGGGAEVYYIKNGGSQVSIPVTGFPRIIGPTTLQMINNDTLQFFLKPVGFSISITLIIKNSSDGNVTLDTINYTFNDV